MKILFFNTIALLLCGTFLCLNQTENSAIVTKASLEINEVQPKYSNAQIEAFIREVFQSNADQLVFQDKSSGRLEMITEFLNKRFDIQYRPEYTGKKFDLLSSVELSNKYNPNLKRDYSITKTDLFNPLKYNFPMHSKNQMMYRIDNTDYIIIILPIK